MLTMTSDIDEHEADSDAMFVCIFDGVNWWQRCRHICVWSVCPSPSICFLPNLILYPHLQMASC